MRSGGGSFQHPLTEPLFSRQPSYLPLFLSLCFSSRAFKTAVHLSVQLANWALSVTGPTVNSDRWNPFKHAAFQHFRWYYRNHQLLSGNDPFLPLRRLNEADRGQEKKTSSAGVNIMHQQCLTSHSCLELVKASSQNCQQRKL